MDLWPNETNQRDSLSVRLDCWVAVVTASWLLFLLTLFLSCSRAVCCKNGKWERKQDLPSGGASCQEWQAESLCLGTPPSCPWPHSFLKVSSLHILQEDSVPA